MRQARGEIILINIYYQILLSRYNEKIDGTTIYMAYISSGIVSNFYFVILNKCTNLDHNSFNMDGIIPANIIDPI